MREQVPASSGFLLGLAIEQAHQGDTDGADHDRRIGDIEGWPVKPGGMPLDEIDDRTEAHAIDPLVEELSTRELEIMEWVRQGKTNAEIGIILDISAFTVKNHMQRILKKLDVLNRAQAVAKMHDHTHK